MPGEGDRDTLLEISTMFVMTRVVIMLCLVVLMYCWKRADKPVSEDFGIVHTLMHLLSPFDGEHFLKLTAEGYTEEINHAFLPLTPYFTA